jgi:hypothetical protein
MLSPRNGNAVQNAEKNKQSQLKINTLKKKVEKKSDYW